MVTWSNLLDGTNIYGVAMSANPSMVSSFFSARVLPALYLDGLVNVMNYVIFWWSALTSSLLLVVVFFAFWYLAFVPAIRTLGKWW